MITADDFRRIILDALAAGETFDSFRTRLRQKLREIASEPAPTAARILPFPHH